MKNRNMWPFMIICCIIGIFIVFSFNSTAGQWHMGYGGFMMFPGFIIFICIIMMFFMCFKRGGMCGRGHNHQESDESSLSILKKRYAKGEITKKQYESMKKEIK